MRRGLVGEQVGADAAADDLGQDFGGVSEQADRDGLTLGVAGFDHRDRFVDAVRLLVEIAGAQAHLDAARLAFDREARCARHYRRERLRAAHAAEAGGEQPAPCEAAAIMLAAHFDEGFVSALNDALTADVDPAARGHLAVHHQALFIELVEMIPVRPFGDEVRIGEQHARRILVCAENADGLARLDEEGLVSFEPLQRLDDPVIAVPVARGAADAAIDDEFVRRLGDVGVEIVHQHPHRRFGEPAFRADLGAGRRADHAAVVEPLIEGAGGHAFPFAKSRVAAITCSRTGRIAGLGSRGDGQLAWVISAGSVM